MNGLQQPVSKRSIVHGVGLPTANRLHTALTKRLANYRKPVLSAALQRGSLSVMPSTTGKSPKQQAVRKKDKESALVAVIVPVAEYWHPQSNLCWTAYCYF